MVAPATVDTALLAVAQAARTDRKAAKAERARAMDLVVELLLERSLMRHLLRECLPYMWSTAPRSSALSDQSMMPKAIARTIEAILEEK